VGIAQAIIHSPDVVILDEPTVGLDPIQIREIRQLIRDIGTEHSVILSTHILPEVQATCDRVQIINKGELVLSDSIDGLTRRMQSSSLLVALRTPPADGEITSIDGVTAVESLGDGRLRISHTPEAHPAEAIVECAVNGGWGLFELTPERLSLEDVFVNITTTETTEEDAE
jgi:ABC-2 type transport system ATP-binding protein